ncbi:hypothetical protein CFC21_019055 [Triticum aestivum]|uniref:Uncharacterized protein n=3 Tax=Triticum TaxID=4564 RepID=A0A9R1P4Q0_TRITD|nr:translation initiation factor IF-2-like [Triticum dicoccoides]XP_044459077.1 translation initiation factor IF-2-like [Triticum aestivum]KAF7003770.1 hypothetical protein CFC21_019055 [Triticum aestivum]VAH36816.1 unnamed protein product [Triticum turgidum subsp. durum]
MAATRKPRSPSAAAAAGDHLRFLRPGALARLRDARLRRRSKPAYSRPAPASPQPQPSPSPPPAPAAGGDGESGPFVPYVVPGSRFLAPRCPQRKKLTAGKVVPLFSPPMPSPDLPFEAVMEFFNAPDMVVAAH